MEGLIEIAVAYVDFALRWPALFKLMFGDERTEGDVRVMAAAQGLRDLLAIALGNVFPGSDTDGSVTASWALVTGSLPSSRRKADCRRFGVAD